MLNFSSKKIKWKYFPFSISKWHLIREWFVVYTVPAQHQVFNYQAMLICHSIIRTHTSTFSQTNLFFIRENAVTLFACDVTMVMIPIKVKIPSPVPYPKWLRIQNRNVHISGLNGTLWDMEQVHSGIGEIGLIHHALATHEGWIEMSRTAFQQHLWPQSHLQYVLTYGPGHQFRSHAMPNDADAHSTRDMRNTCVIVIESLS